MVNVADSRIRQIHEPIRAELDEVVEALVRLASETGPFSELGPLGQAMMSGGKRLRPAVTLLSSQFHPHDPNVTITMATAVELLHFASLIHDDTVDDSAMRRGSATVSNLWGGKVAVLLGDYVFATSATYVCDTGNVRVIRRFSEAIMELAKGELSEHFSTHNWQQSVGEYEQRIYNKSASLFSTASECGAVLSGVSESQCGALKTYGFALGMAFQIMDDILDFQGTESELGKPVGNDLINGTLTLPTLLFIQNHSTEPLIQRLKNGDRDPKDLRRVVEMIRNSSAIDETMAFAERYRDQALESLSSLERGRARNSLKELADYSTSRRT